VGVQIDQSLVVVLAEPLALVADGGGRVAGFVVPPHRAKGRLADALHYHGLDGMETVEKDRMRQVAQRGAPFSEEERCATTLGG
jgi:hypothetical protein